MEFVHQLTPRLIVEGVGQILRHSLETSEASVAPLRAVGGYHLAVFVELVGISGEHGGHGERIVFAEFQAQACAQVAPGLSFRGEVVGERSGEFVDEGYFPFARGVAVGFHLHFQVVRYGHGDHALLRP